MDLQEASAKRVAVCYSSIGSNILNNGTSMPTLTTRAFPLTLLEMKTVKSSRCSAVDQKNSGVYYPYSISASAGCGQYLLGSRSGRPMVGGQLRLESTETVCCFVIDRNLDKVKFVLPTHSSLDMLPGCSSSVVLVRQQKMNDDNVLFEF